MFYNQFPVILFRHCRNKKDNYLEALFRTMQLYLARHSFVYRRMSVNRATGYFPVPLSIVTEVLQ